MVKKVQTSATTAKATIQTKEKAVEKMDEDKKDVADGFPTTEEIEQKVKAIKDQSRVALSALRTFLSASGGKSLFPELDHALHLNVVYKKPAVQSDRARLKIKLPHSPRTLTNTSICIIMPDLDQSEEAKRDVDVDMQARQWADKIEKEHGITKKHYAKIMTKRQLEREHRTYKGKKALATAYDLFIVDSRVMKSVNVILGKEFNNKRPLEFRYARPMATSIQESLDTVIFPMRKFMTRVSISVGHLGQESSDLGENIDAVVDSFLAQCPGGVSNVRSIYLSPTGSKPNLPVYTDDGSANDVKLPGEKKLKIHQKTVEDCNTLPDGLKLSVSKAGKIRVLKEEDNKAVLYPTRSDEWEQRDINKPEIDVEKVQKRRSRKMAQRGGNPGSLAAGDSAPAKKKRRNMSKSAKVVKA